MEYEPLTWPDDRPPRGLARARPSFWRKAKEHVGRQLARRVPVPEGVWGEDRRRREIARFITATIKECFGYANDHFVPEDPIALVLLDIDGTELLMEIEDKLEAEMHDGGLPDCSEATFGEVVDVLLLASRVERTSWPRRGPGSLEARACPSGAAFRDVRAFLGMRCLKAKREIRPSTSIDGVVPVRERGKVSEYVAQRFRVRAPATHMFLGKVWEVWPWLGANAFCFALMCWLIGPGPAAAALLPLQFPIILPIHWLSRWEWVEPFGTVGDLVRWIVTERERKRAKRKEPRPAPA